MAYPQTLIVCYHTVTCGQPLLKPWEAGDLWEDYFVEDGEPEAGRQSKADAPDVPGRVNGALFHRGNTRWSMDIPARWVYFGNNTFPLVLEDPVGVIPAGTYDSPEALAQKWLAQHLRALPDGNATLNWDGLSFPNTVLSAKGRTNGPFAVVQYSATCAEA